MPTDIESDPNPITSTTGGVPNFNILDAFQSFGYEPTQAEINALAPAFSGRTNVEATGMSAVSAYVIAHQQVKGAQSLIQGQLQGAEDRAAQYAALGTGNIQSAADLYNQAPQLFGGLTQDQVSQYLKPLQTQFDYGLGQVQGAAASRGLTGSSTESTAMAQAQQQYQQQVLQQALQLGIQQQQQRAQTLSGLGTQQLGLANTQYGMVPGLLQQNTNTAEDLAQLPGQATSQAIAQQAEIKAMNGGGSGSGSMISGGLQGALSGAMAGGMAAGPWGALAGGVAGGGLGAYGASQGNASGFTNPLLLTSLLGGRGMFGGSPGGTTTQPQGNTGLAFPQGGNGMMPTGYGSIPPSGYPQLMTANPYSGPLGVYGAS